MSMFRRKNSNGPSTPQRTGAPKFQGRHLHSSEDEATCIANFLSVTGASEADRFQPTWTGDPAKAPTSIVGIRQPGGPVYLALWPHGGYQEAIGYQEMAFVLPNFDPDAPIPVGQWKQLDRSLSSIGYTQNFAVVD